MSMVSSFREQQIHQIIKPITNASFTEFNREIQSLVQFWTKQDVFFPFWQQVNAMQGNGENILHRMVPMHF